MTNSKVKGFLIERDGRCLFMKEVEAWAIEDVNYKVTPLVSGLMEDREELVAEPSSLPTTDDTQERLQLLEELFELEEAQISQMKSKLEEFVELVEAIVDIATPTDNIIENKAKLLLIAESCKKLLKPKD